MYMLYCTDTTSAALLSSPRRRAVCSLAAGTFI